jgi:hypothetical protein
MLSLDERRRVYQLNRIGHQSTTTDTTERTRDWPNPPEDRSLPRCK